MSNTIHNICIAMCVNDGYVPYICVTIKSILENNHRNKVCIYVISDFISNKMCDRLNEVVSDYPNASLKIIIVNPNRLFGLKDTWTLYTWYRVLLPDALGNDVHRVLYLDADVVVVDDLRELFKIDMTNIAIAGALDPLNNIDETFERCGYDRSKSYICAGVMLMNLDYWRENNLSERIIKYGKENHDKIRFPDQDTINYLCRDSKIILPLRYGIMNVFFKNKLYYSSNYIMELYDCAFNPAIIHYAGTAPWKREFSNNIYQSEWNKYNRLLKHPAKKMYITKGLNLLKVRIWNLLHWHKRNVLDITEYRSKISRLVNSLQ